MQIWVDADAGSKPIKEILFRAAERLQVPMDRGAFYVPKTR
jgi:uncharacterized protein YaiI (UPF0178 family)